MENLRFWLIPTGIRNYMLMIKKVGIYAAIGIFLLFGIMVLSGAIHDLFTGVIFFVCGLSFSIVMLTPGILFGGHCMTVVCLCDGHINVLDKKGICRRSIPYSKITAVRKEIVPGFSYGNKQDQIQGEYICVFLNDTTSIPEVSYLKKFVDADFFMFGYHPEALAFLQQSMNSGR